MAIKVERLSFSYGKQRVIDDCSFCLEKGRIMSLLGRNGSGKTTLLRLLTGSLKAQNGLVQVDGIDVNQASRSRLGRLIAYVPQAHQAVFAYTAIDMVVMGRNPHLGIFSRPGREDYARAAEALEQVGMLHLQNRYYMDMSGGEQQLVFLARALAQEACYYILDEPTSHLDYYNQHAIMRTLEQIVKTQNCGILIAIHDPNLALSIAHAALLLKEGCILDMGEVGTTMTAQNLSTLYNMDLDILSLDGKHVIVCN